MGATTKLYLLRRGYSLVLYQTVFLVSITKYLRQVDFMKVFTQLTVLGVQGHSTDTGPPLVRTLLAVSHLAECMYEEKVTFPNRETGA